MIIQHKKTMTIGRSDRADFPLLELDNIRVKVDTGAYTSSLHSSDIEVIDIDGKPTLRFRLFDPSHPAYKERLWSFKEFTERSVKSSNGISEKRYAIESVIRLFGRDYPILLTLTDRSDMRYPVLLGRSLLRQGFRVDVRRKNLSLRSQKKHD